MKESPLQPTLVSLAAQISALVHERQSLLVDLANGPPEPVPWARAVRPLSDSDKLRNEIHSRSERVVALADALIATCKAARWEQFE